MPISAAQEVPNQPPAIPGDDDVALDVTLGAPAALGSATGRAGHEVRRHDWKSIQLEFDEVQTDGSGCAHDPKTQERFMLAPGMLRTAALSKGQRFLARVSRAHLVTRIIVNG